MNERSADAASRLLEELSSDPRGVAPRLLADGARMTRPFADACDVADSCPVAVWLQMRTGLPWRVRRLIAYRDWGPMIDLPAAVTSFVERFDAGRHPELEAKK